MTNAKKNLDLLFQSRRDGHEPWSAHEQHKMRKVDGVMKRGWVTDLWVLFWVHTVVLLISQWPLWHMSSLPYTAVAVNTVGYPQYHKYKSSCFSEDSYKSSVLLHYLPMTLPNSYMSSMRGMYTIWREAGSKRWDNIHMKELKHYILKQIIVQVLAKTGRAATCVMMGTRLGSLHRI
jgi:hypothetical protein